MTALISAFRAHVSVSSGVAFASESVLGIELDAVNNNEPVAIRWMSIVLVDANVPSRRLTII